MKKLLLPLLLIAVNGGCTTLSLERNTVYQAKSLTDLRYREVLDNLAMIANNPALLPAFSTFYAGTTDLTDTVQATSTSIWNRFPIKAGGTFTALGSQSLDAPLTRAVKQNWTLDPTIVPEKLVAMRSACQLVLFGSQYLDVGSFAILKKYQPPDPATGKAGDPPGYYFDVADQLARLPAGWLHMGSPKDVPRHLCYKAQCHGTSVWVTADGLDGLTTFTLILQDLARVDFGSVYFPLPVTRKLDISLTRLPPLPPSPQFPRAKVTEATVTVYVDENGFLTPGPNLPAIPLKVRFDSIAPDANLRSVINASSKSP